MWTELWFKVWSGLFLVVLRPMIKWFLRKVTGKCELLRITYEELPGGARTKRIEKCLKRSRQHILKQLSNEEEVNISELVTQVMTLKNILPEVHSKFEEAFSTCVCQICGYKKLLSEVESRRTVFYSSENSNHEAQLMELWSVLMPDTVLQSRITKQWTHIGFQGEDPRTDFRGMGMLGLDQLIYFAREYTDTARNLLTRSHHPKYGFSYAVVGINFTGMSYSLLKSRKLRMHFYNLKTGRPIMNDFHEIYCYLFHEFVSFWFEEEPKDIMEFGRIRDKFQKKVVQKLKNPSTILEANFQEKRQGIGN